MDLAAWVATSPAPSPRPTPSTSCCPNCSSPPQCSPPFCTGLHAAPRPLGSPSIAAGPLPLCSPIIPCAQLGCPTSLLCQFSTLLIILFSAFSHHHPLKKKFPCLPQIFLHSFSLPPLPSLPHPFFG